jgi:hypothetical protein
MSVPIAMDVENARGNGNGDMDVHVSVAVEYMSTKLQALFG